MLTSKGFSVFFWITLSHEVSRHFPHTQHINIRELQESSVHSLYTGRYTPSQETMESMVGAQFFSTMDLKSGFWQVKMSEKSWQCTAFTVGSMGIFEFLRMPYGLCNAPATFQRLMQNCLGELNLTYALIYLDDVIVFSWTEEEHLTRLRAVFERFREHGLKLKASKCHFLRKEIAFLGHKVLEEGMKPRDEGLKSIAEMAPPCNYTEIRRFLGFIKNYARIARPLNDLLEDEASKWKTQPVDLPPEAVEAFNLLKTKCVTAPVLAFADFKKPFLWRPMLPHVA